MVEAERNGAPGGSAGEGPPVARASIDRAGRRGGLLAGLRIRQKLIVLHTAFTLVLSTVLLLGLWPAVSHVIAAAERTEAGLVLRQVLEGDEPPQGLRAEIVVERGTAAELGLDATMVEGALAAPGEVVFDGRRQDLGVAIAVDRGQAGSGAATFVRVQVRDPAARGAVVQLYAVVVLALLAIYALVALALETLVLPRQVYGPIGTMLEAERAVREGRREGEIIPAGRIPADELGEIMRSRNDSVRQLREQERALAAALEQLERVASDLARKNHLLERAREHLADADRLRSLAIMSAGLAHEMNTPLTVLKGLAERLEAEPAGGLEPQQAALMARVVGRLEGLSESLLDFARVRPPSSRPVDLREVVEEAGTLVRIDREAHEMSIENRLPAGLVVECDGDRMVQVFVNLIRNAVDALREEGAGREPAATSGGSAGLREDQPRIWIESQRQERLGESWVSVRVCDNGPGIDPEVIQRLFEPFVSTRLDARGTGLGLAVAEGIVREHGGVMLARNERPGGAVFEVLLPETAQPVGAGGGADDGERHG